MVLNSFNISTAAKTMHTSQPGVSKQIQLLEEEIGVQIFQRHGKRLVGLTDPGEKVFDSISEIIRESRNISGSMSYIDPKNVLNQIKDCKIIDLSNSINEEKKIIDLISEK